MEHDEDIPPEEKEKWNLDRERDADALNDYVKVERVIGMQEDDEGETEYLVKCEFTLLVHTCVELTVCREGPLLRLLHLGEC
jgi:chromodomain-helicase-DNA-binding protein 1